LEFGDVRTLGNEARGRPNVPQVLPIIAPPRWTGAAFEYRVYRTLLCRSLLVLYGKGGKGVRVIGL
jgi:hypothetical protein